MWSTNGGGGGGGGPGGDGGDGDGGDGGGGGGDMGTVFTSLQPQTLKFADEPSSKQSTPCGLKMVGWKFLSFLRIPLFLLCCDIL